MKIRNRKALLGASAVAASLLAAGVSHAAAATWDGGGGDDFTNTAANWASDLTPAALDALVFDGAVRTTPDHNIAAGTVFRGLTFAAGAAPFTLSGNGITLQSNTQVVGATNVFTGIINNSPVAQTVNLPLTLALGDHSITGSSGLTLGGAITRNTGATARFSGTVTAPALANDSTGIIGNWATIGGDHATVSGGQIVPYTSYTAVGDTAAGPSPIPNAPGAN